LITPSQLEVERVEKYENKQLVGIICVGIYTCDNGDEVLLQENGVGRDGEYPKR
jgi:hypothetical protein